MAADDPAPQISDPGDLFSIPVDRFTEARDELARWLRAQDREEEAREVGKLRKPSVAAWALNRASRDNTELVDRLLDSHRRLRKAGDMSELQAATEERRRAVYALTEAAAGALRAEGRPVSAQTRERIGETLMATATDSEAEVMLVEGRLTRELEPTGAGWGQMGLPQVQVDPNAKARAAAEDARARADRLVREAADAERQLEAAERTVKEARRRAKTLRAEAEKASAEAGEAEKEAG